MINVGELVRHARLSRGLTQKDVEVALGKVSKTGGKIHFMTQIENNVNSPQVNTLERIADAMGYELVMKFKRKSRAVL